MLYAKYKVIARGDIWFYTDYSDLSEGDIRFFKKVIITQCLENKTIPIHIIPVLECKVELVSIILIQPIRKEENPRLLHEI
jgi:hypothetical protein